MLNDSRQAKNGRILLTLLLTLTLLLSTSSLALAAAGDRAPQSGAAPLGPVQVFDVNEGRVIKTVPNDDEIQALAAGWLASIKGLAPQIMSGQDCSFVFRIPLKEPANIKVNGLALQTSDLFLFYCPNKEPSLLVFDAERKPYMLQFTGDIQPLLQKAGL